MPTRPIEALLAGPKQLLSTLAHEIIDNFTETGRGPIKYCLHVTHKMKGLDAAHPRVFKWLVEIALVIKDRQQQVEHAQLEIFLEREVGCSDNHLFDLDYGLTDVV